MSWASKIRSSDFVALADDAGKDDENVSFLAALPLAQQSEWLTRIRWLRVADRLAENQMLEPHDRRFEIFCAEWRAFAATGVPHASEHQTTWREMQAAWYAPSGEVREPRATAAWGEYLDALGEYTHPGLEIPTLEEHDRMLRRLTGSLFEVFPYVSDSQRDAAAGFGMLDQMMNNLRDIAEDAAHGLCFFPRDVLDRFGVTRASVFHGSAIGTPEYGAMMELWMDGHLAKIRHGAEPFIAMRDLHPSVARMRDACVVRYARVEEVLRGCEMDYLAFPREYWRSRRPTMREAQGVA